MKQISTFLFVGLASYVHVSSAVSDAIYHACYSNSGSLQVKGTDEFQSRGACRGTCTASPGYSVQAMTNGTACLCGNHLPNDQYKVEDSKCKQYCPGFKDETCGTRLGDYFSVYITGLEESPDQDPVSTSSTEGPTPTPGVTPTDVNPHPGPTTSADLAPSPSSTSTPKKSVNKAGVAAGVVVGLLVLVTACAFAYFLIRKRKRRQVEEEYKRSAAAREFAKHPIQDHRLDPVMAQRRDSAGSIADNQDFSRRILKVTNPDDR